MNKYNLKHVGGVLVVPRDDLLEELTHAGVGVRLDGAVERLLLVRDLVVVGLAHPGLLQVCDHLFYEWKVNVLMRYPSLTIAPLMRNGVV
jgi:hypothetical protein